MAAFSPRDWEQVRFVAFDVDGTLYDQRPLHLRMARDMALHVATTGDLKTVLVLRAYRRIRERLAAAETAGFDRVLVAETAEATRASPDEVTAIVSEWIERRPLKYLKGCVYPGVPQLFGGLRRQGKKIGILSDYPATEKLEAMGLSADHVIAASDVGVLKPNSKGLHALMVAAAASARDTVFIGDRVERDGLAAQRAGVVALIRSLRPIAEAQTFRSYRDPLFAPLLA
jgi:putative hydrolase of the HAD superfamily